MHRFFLKYFNLAVVQWHNPQALAEVSLDFWKPDSIPIVNGQEFCY